MSKATTTTTTTAKTTSTATTAAGEFDVEAFEQKLTTLKDTQDGIQQMSAWCLQHRAFHKKIVNSWLNVLKQVRVEHRLILFYLANDVIQYSKRKNYEFVESWGTPLQKATTMVRDEKVRNKIFRIFKIWEQRDIYSEEYLSDLNGLLSMNPVKKTQQPITESSDDFQNTVLISNIRECVKLEKSTDKNFKNLPKAPNCDIETIKNNLKDRSHSDDAEKDIDEFVNALEAYIKSLKSEIKSRKSLINHIVQADTFYTNQRGEVKVVVNAYKNFGNRIKLVKKKLDELTPNLPSPIPSPDINAPSPEQDADIQLPDDQSNISINMFKNPSNGYASYMDGNLPFDINDFKRESPKKQSLNYEANTTGTQQIQVINNRSEHGSDSSYDDFYKSNDSAYTPIDAPVQVPPVGSNYGTITHQQSTSAGNIPYSSNNSMLGSGRGGGYPNSSGPPPSTSNYGGGYNDSTYTSTPNTNPGNRYDQQMPLMPPPMPPLLGVSDDFNSTWDMDMTWTSINSNNSFNSSVIDTPVSPPHFEREAVVNPDLVEYMEDGIEDEMVSLQDVDHRQLHIPPSSLLKDKGRTIDVDHRNLISLTGSPGPRSFESNNKTKKSTINSSPKTNPFQRQKSVESTDTDYRRQTSSSSTTTTQGSDIDYRSQHHQGSRERNRSNSTSSTDESPRKRENSFSEKSNCSSATTNLSEPSASSALHPPPLLPSLDASMFSGLNQFLTPPPNFNSSIQGQICQSSEENEVPVTKVSTVATTTTASASTATSKKGMGKDNVESIDMDVSDEDGDEQFKDNSQKLNITAAGTATMMSQNDVVDDNVNQTRITEMINHQRPALLETPTDIQPWAQPQIAILESGGIDGLDGDMLSSMGWKSARMPSSGLTQFRMPIVTIAQQYSARLPFIQPPPRGFNHSPQIKPNFRDQFGGAGGIGPRNSPYFNNRSGGRFGGNGGRKRARGSGFRGPSWN